MQTTSTEQPVERIDIAPGDITPEQTLAVTCPKCAAGIQTICRGGIQHATRYGAAARHFADTGRSPRSFTPKRKAALALTMRHLDPADRQRVHTGQRTLEARRSARLHPVEPKPWITRLHHLDDAKTCLACNKPITPGSNYAVGYDKATKTRTAYHPDCAM